MPEYSPSLAEIKKKLLEDMGCAGCGGMTAGDGGFTSNPTQDGVDGFDPVMSGPMRRTNRTLDKLKKKRKKKALDKE